MWTTNSCGWDDRGADLQCVVCRYSQDGKPQDPNEDPAANIVIFLVTREVVASNEAGAYKVLNHFETAGYSSTAGPQTRFNEFHVPGRYILAAPGGRGSEIVKECFTNTAACEFPSSIKKTTKTDKRDMSCCRKSILID